MSLSPRGRLLQRICHACMCTVSDSDDSGLSQFLSRTPTLCASLLDGDAIPSYFMDRLLLRFVSSLYEQIQSGNVVLRHFGGHNYTHLALPHPD
jgi:hypothetical protein